MGPPGMLVASAFVSGCRPGSTAIFSPKASFQAKSACLNRALAGLLEKSPPREKALTSDFGPMAKARHTSFYRLTQQEVSAAAARHQMHYSGRSGRARFSPFATFLA